MPREWRGTRRCLLAVGAARPPARRAGAGAPQASVQGDFRAGNQLEIEHLLGMVVREGRAMNVPVPASAALVTALWKFRNGAAPE